MKYLTLAIVLLFFTQNTLAADCALTALLAATRASLRKSVSAYTKKPSTSKSPWASESYQVIHSPFSDSTIDKFSSNLVDNLVQKRFPRKSMKMSYPFTIPNVRGDGANDVDAYNVADDWSAFPTTDTALDLISPSLDRRKLKDLVMNMSDTDGVTISKPAATELAAIANRIQGCINSGAYVDDIGGAKSNSSRIRPSQ